MQLGLELVGLIATVNFGPFVYACHLLTQLSTLQFERGKIFSNHLPDKVWTSKEDEDWHLLRLTRAS